MFSARVYVLILQLICLCLCLQTSTSDHPHNESNLNTTETYANPEETSSNSFEDAANYFKIILLIAAAALQSKGPMLWSESRILRKVRTRFPGELRNTVTPNMLSNPQDPDPYEVFFHLYLHLSKGRHRSYSRAYSALFYGFLYMISIADFVYFRRGKAEVRLTTSEAFIVLRLPVLINSLTVLGATSLTMFESLCLFFTLTANATIIMLIGLGHVHVSEEADNALMLVFVIGFVIVILVEICYFVYVNLGFASSMSDIVGRMWLVQRERWKEEPSCNQDPITTKLLSRQKRRLEEVSEALRGKDLTEKTTAETTMQESFVSKIRKRFVEKDFEKLIGFFDIFAWTALNLISALTWGEEESKELSVLVFMETLDLLAAFMLYVNDTRVEEILFEELLRIAHMPQTT